jgi:Ca2+ transporting ATPase
MVTGDVMETAVSIARNCNILPADYVYTGNDYTAMKGPDFAREVEVSETEVDDHIVTKVANLDHFSRIASELRVLSGASYRDKFVLVTGLKQLGSVVAVTGDGTNDAAALKKADVGLAMNVVGTDVAKEASDIILVDDNFATVITAVKWGRNIYDCIRKFLQFQLTVNVVALTMVFIGALSVQVSPLYAVQMLWVNLIMNSFAALALATEPSTKTQLNRQPIRADEYIITKDMFVLIGSQAIYQITWLIIVLFAGPAMFDITPGWEDKMERSTHFTLFFHAFVWLQIFNEINCRKLGYEDWNVFSRFFNNYLFLTIIAGTIFFQFIIVQFGGEPLNTKPLTVG